MRLQNAPVALVLAQIRFPAELGMADHVAALQKSFKDLGFVRYYERAITEIRITNEKAETSSKPRWDFINKESTWSVAVAQDFMTLSTTAYPEIKGFLAKLNEAVACLDKSVQLSVVDRAGMRMVDIVRPTPELPRIQQWIHAGLCGFPSEALGDDVKLEAATTMSVMHSAFGTLIVRSGTLGEHPLPPDLMPAVLELRARLQGGGERWALDFDHFIQWSNQDFDQAALMSCFRDLHSTLKVAFRCSVTEAARTAWGPEVAE